MRKLFAIAFLFLSACTSVTQKSEMPEPGALSEAQLQEQLGLKREITDLGFNEAGFDPCVLGANVGPGCQRRVMAVIHFQLLCRDSVGSVSEVPTVKPLVADPVRWSVGEFKGATLTDADGYGQVVVISTKSIAGKRLIFRLGKQFVGVTASEVNKLVLPQNFCS